MDVLPRHVDHAQQLDQLFAVRLPFSRMPLSEFVAPVLSVFRQPE